MFFVFAKVLWFLLQPSSLMTGALMAGSLLTFTAWRRLAGTLLFGALTALLVCGLSPLADVLIHPLEQRFPRAELARSGPPVAGIIVLGGAWDDRAVGSPDVVPLGEAGERYTEAVVLTRRLPEAKLVFSGGSGTLIVAELPEAEVAARLFAALGVPEGRMVLESKSRDTCENARFSAQLLAPQSDQRWLLLTSASHMPRAVGSFRKAGWPVVAYPVNYGTTGESMPPFQFNFGYGINSLSFAIHEYVGLLSYWLTGKTDALFPGPGR